MRQHPGRQESGQALAEYGLTVVLFMTLVTFLIDGSRVMWAYLSLQEAARVGARYAIVNSSAPASAVQSLVQAKAVGVDPTPAVTVAYASAGHEVGSALTVTASSLIRPVTGLFWEGMTFKVAVHSRMQIRH
jgi:Flp pilus assembly protein TadG